MPGRGRKSKEERREYAQKFYAYINSLEKKPHTREALRELHNSEFRSSLRISDVKISFSCALYEMRGMKMIRVDKSSGELVYGRKKVAIDQGFVERRAAAARFKEQTESDSEDDVEVEDIEVVVLKKTRAKALVQELLKRR